MRNKSTVTTSLIFSIGLHVVFLSLAANIKFSDKIDLLDKKEKLFFIKTVDIKETREKQFHQSELGSEETIKFQSPAFVDMPGGLTGNEKILEKQLAQIDNKHKEQLENPSKIDMEDLLKEKEKKSNFLKMKESRETREQLVEVSMDESYSELQSYVKKIAVSDDFIDRMPGFTPGFNTEVPDDLALVDTNQLGGKSSVIKRTLHSDDVAKLFGGDVLVFEDPQDGQKYFQLKIRAAKTDEHLPVLPKEIIFLIDCSISIEQKRLDQFKKGVEHSLKHLNEQDYFNIITFKESIDKFKRNPVQPTENNIKQALKFIDELTAGQKTDTYNALSKSINLNSKIKPSYIFLLSDGRPTKGITDTQELINEISRANDGKISIFAFSGGSWVDRYLLDFITYKNRGWAEYSNRSQFIGRDLGKMYDKIRNPVLLDLRYYASGIETSEIFPQNLPDLYQNVEFTLYGKYQNEDEFVLQLNGSVEGELKTYTMARSLKDAKKGNDTIARNWAFNKIYYLIGKLQENKDNQEIINEINELSKKFKIKTPYQKRF